MGAACGAVLLRLLWYQNGRVAIVCYISGLFLCPKSKPENSGDIALPLRPYLQKGGAVGRGGLWCCPLVPVLASK